MSSNLIVIVGPTAVGKTELSLSLADKIGGEIISADSRLFYRSMDIGTAKPTPAERRRVPHHLIDVTDPQHTWTLAQFQRAAAAAIEDIQKRGRVPLLVGGTGQYIRAVIEGWDLPALEPHQRLRAVLEEWGAAIGAQALHARLAVIDPQAAAFVDAPNLRRTVRALEVIFLSGRRFSAQRRRSASPYRCLLIGLNRPRPELYERIDRRIEAMLAAGFVDEVRGLLQKGLSPDLPSMSAIGYKQIAAHLLGGCSLDEAVVQIKRQTRVFVRRQAAWFRPDDPEIAWFTPSPEAQGAIQSLIEKFLEDTPEV